MDKLGHIFVINLKRRPDRWEHIQNVFKKYNITDYERFDAIDPIYEDIPESHYNMMNLSYPESIGSDLKKYKTGACGCKYSHVEIMKIAKERKYKTVTIIEDDADIINDLIEIPDDFDMFMLAGTFYQNPIAITPNINKIGWCFTTLGYIANESIYDNIIENANDSGIEIDVFYARFIQYKLNNTYIHNPHVLTSIKGFSDVVNLDVDYSIYNL